MRKLSIARAGILIFFVLAVALFVNAECGNNACEPNENECSCAADCGTCSGTVEGELCQIYSCATGVCAPAMSLGCCGNGICERGETFGNCEWDCAPKTVAVELERFEQRSYMRGENVFLEVRVSADSKIAKDATVRVTGLVNVPLYDDGNHNDGTTNDGKYANTVSVPVIAEGQDYPLTITATKTGATGTKSIVLSVDPLLGLEFSLNRERYNLGDNIAMDGTLKRNGMAIRDPVSVDFIVAGRSIFHTEVKPDAEGGFSFERHTSLIDPAGLWTIQATARDGNQNSGFAQEIVEVSGAEGSNYYNVTFVEPVKKAFARGENMDLLVRVEDRNGSTVNGAEVEVLLSKDTTVKLKEVAPGNYGSTLQVPLDFELGKQKITANVSRRDGDTLYSGFAETNVYINKSPIMLEIISPNKSTFSLGERLEFRINVLYSPGRPVEHALVDLNLNGRLIRAEEIGGGIYVLQHTLPAEDGIYYVNILATDKYKNAEEKGLVFSITSDLPAFYLILNNPLALAVLIVVAVLALIIGGLAARNFFMMKMLKKRRNELIGRKKKLQNSYFNERAVGAEEYYPQIDKYNEELGKVDAGMQSLKEKGKRQ